MRLSFCQISLIVVLLVLIGLEIYMLATEKKTNMYDSFNDIEYNKRLDNLASSIAKIDIEKIKNYLHL